MAYMVSVWCEKERQSRETETERDRDRERQSRERERERERERDLENYSSQYYDTIYTFIRILPGHTSILGRGIALDVTTNRLQC